MTSVVVQVPVGVQINTWSLKLPFAHDSESGICEWCKAPTEATDWTQAEQAGKPLSRAYFHCVDHIDEAEVQVFQEMEKSLCVKAVSNV